MSGLDKKELIFDYSNLLEKQITKTAWTWRDLVTDFGIDAGVTAGFALLGIGGALTWPAILGGAAITAALSYALGPADNTLEDLIGRLDALDPNPQYEGKIAQWIQTLNQHRTILNTHPDTANEQQAAMANFQRKQAVDKVVAYLEGMWKEWPIVKQNLTDRVFDPDQAEYALKTTLQTMRNSQAQIKLVVNKEASEQLSRMKKEFGDEFSILSNNILSLYKQLTQLSGGIEPKFDTEQEQSAWAFANKIVDPSKSSGITPQDIQVMVPYLKSLEQTMQKAVGQVKQRQAKASFKPAISKRALTVSDGKEEFRVGPVSSGKGKVSTRSEEVRQMQRLINALTDKFYPRTEHIKEDGIYGPQTARALNSVLSYHWDIENLAKQHAGVDFSDVKNIQYMRNNTEVVSKLSAVLSQALKTDEFSKGYSQEKGVGSEVQRKPISTREETEYTPGVRCNPAKENPTTADILNCMKNYFRVTDPDTDQEIYAYDWLSGFVDASGRRLVSDDKMIRWIIDQFPPGRFSPREWSKSRFVSYVKLKDEYKNKQKSVARRERETERRLLIPTEPDKLLYYMQNHFKIHTRTGETRYVYNWMETLGLDEALMVQWMNEFIAEEGGDRVWDTTRTPTEFMGFVLNRMGGREGGARII